MGTIQEFPIALQASSPLPRGGKLQSDTTRLKKSFFKKEEPEGATHFLLPLKHELANVHGRNQTGGIGN